MSRTARLARWLRSWRAALRVARREAWRRPADARRSALVAVLVGLPVLAATGYVTLLSTPAVTSHRQAVLRNLPEGVAAELTPHSLGHPVTQDPLGSWSTSEAAVAPTERVSRALPDELARLRGRLPAADRLYALRDTQLVAFADDDRYQVRARLTEVPVGPGTGPAPSSTTGLRQLVTGAPPSGGRVVVNPELARLLNLSTGGTLTLAPSLDPSAGRRTVTVSGIAELDDLGGGPALLGEAGAVVASPAAGRVTAGPESQVRVLVTGPEPVTWAQVQAVNALGWRAVSRHVVEQQPGTYQEPVLGSGPDPDPARVALGTEIAGLVLLQLVLLAAPAMAVGARRRQRVLALAAVAGADRAQVRRVVLSLGAWMGGPGALAGALAGVGVTLLLPDGAWADENPGWNAVPWPAVGVLALTGLLVAVLAAAVPAVAAARLDPVAVLKGRRTGGSAPPKAPWPGLALLVLGTAITLLPPHLGLGRSTTRALVSVLGLAFAEVGLILTLPAVLALLARGARNGPLFLRLALRDADRHRLRTVPAVAAATAAIAGSIAVQMFLTANDARETILRQDSAPHGSLVLRIDSNDPLAPGDGDRWRAQVRRALAGTGVRDVTPVWTLGSGQSRVYYGSAWPEQASSPWATTAAGLLPAPGTCTTGPTPCTSAADRLHRPELRLGIAVGDAGTVRALAGRELPEATRALASGRAVITDPQLLWPDGTVRVQLRTTPCPGCVPEDPAATAPARDVAAPAREFRLPAIVVESPVLFEAVLPTGPVRQAVPGADALVRASSAMADGSPPRSLLLPADEVWKRLQMVAPSSSPANVGDDLVLRNLALLAFAALVTVFGAASAVALAASEGRADAATLAAVGAAPRTRRRLAAMQALTVAGLGGLAGTASGLLAGWALLRTIAGQGELVAQRWPDWQASVPWADVVGLGLVLPVVLSATAYLLARSRLPLTRRQT